MLWNIPDSKMPLLQMLAGCEPSTLHRCTLVLYSLGKWVSCSLMVILSVFSEKHQVRDSGRQADDLNKIFLWWDYFNWPVQPVLCLFSPRYFEALCEKDPVSSSGTWPQGSIVAETEDKPHALDGDFRGLLCLFLHMLRLLSLHTRL